VLEIFEFFARFRQPARGFEIASFLAIPKSSANGLLKTLVDTGYLTFNDKSKAYFPSFRMVRFGSWLSSFYFGPDRLIALIEELREESGESVGVTIQNGLYMQFVASLPKQREVFAEGRKLPIFTSASGGALLTTLRDAEIAQLVRRASRAVPHAERLALIDDTLDRIRMFREKGYAVNGSPPWTVKPSAIAVALPRQPDNAPLILSLGGGAKSALALRETYFFDLMQRSIEKHLGKTAIPALER
jgi:DNA-binding IclR family transcriptional regulator